MKIPPPSLFLLPLLLTCCSSDNLQHSADTTSTTTSTPPPNISTFAPDANYSTPKEVVSDFGPGGIVRDVVIDQQGVIWLAAWDGIISYDGKQFTNHTLKDGLGHYRVYSLLNDSKGNMWFGTMGIGAYLYNGAHFTNFNSNNGMIGNVIYDLFEDSKGNTWFATPKGVSRYDGRTFMNLDSTRALRGEVYAISEDKLGRMWFGGESGLFLYDGDSVTELLTWNKTPYTNVRDLYCDGSMWVGAASGLYQYQITDKKTMDVVEINSKFTGYIHPDHNGRLLLTSDGISRYDSTIRMASDPVYDHYTAIVTGVNNLGIFGAREAADGTIWYGAMDGLHSIKGDRAISYHKP